VADDTTARHLGVFGRVLSAPQPGGAASVARRLTAQLSAAFDERTLFGHPSLAGAYPGYDVRRTGFWSRSELYGVAWEQSVVPALLRPADVDVLFAPVGLCPLWPTDAPLVVLVQDIPSFHGYGARPYRLLRRHVLPRVVARADHVVTVSAFTKRDVCRHLPVAPSGVSVVPNGIDEVYLDDAPGDPLDLPDRYVLYVGAMSERKNLQGTLEAFTRFRREYGTDHELVLVGPDENVTYDVQGVETVPPDLVGDVHRLGYVSDRELQSAYEHADGFVYPSRHESFGLPPLEAAACGTPVVTSRAGAIPEVMGDHALYVDPEDPADIADGIHRALAGEDAAETVAAPREHAEQYTWDRAGTALAAVLRAVAAGRDPVDADE
jgi:glycosyltransferase involved in cell wall biosynthesis